MRRARRQSGVAAITAVLIVAVAASAVSVMLAQQSATLDQAMMVASRAQADQYARAGLDWARGVLLQDAASGAAVDSLDEGWARPMTGLPVERALVSGRIVDEQGKFNLNNLVAGGQKSADDIALFRRLLAGQGLAPELADAVVDWIDDDGDNLASGFGAEDAYYLALPRPYRAANQPMTQVEELYRVKGFDAAAVAKLKPLVTALPGGHRAINANTAPAAVLAAALPTLPAEEIARRVAARETKPFRSAAEVAQWVRDLDSKASAAALDVKSAFFTVAVQVAQDDVELALDALVEREAPVGRAASAAIIWRRPRY